MDAAGLEVLQAEDDEIQEVRLVIAIDYGTTFTGVAYATPTGKRSKLEEIDIVDHWGYGQDNEDKVPSVYSYSPASEKCEQQWGRSLSNNAIGMVNTKLELELHLVPDELDMILHALDGMKNLHFQDIQAAGELPDFPWQGPEEIVTDYLDKVFSYLTRVVNQFSDELRVQIPVDVVITVPSVWSYNAINSTYRAMTSAGFNGTYFPKLADYLLITEPEAAAIYTARYLKEKDGKDFLKQNECFVLCDAGGGTVDVVSYRVQDLTPYLELEQIALPTGDKCGSIYIDLAFKNWLRELVGEKNYEKLDPGSLGNKISSHTAEGAHMRKLMRTFDVIKKKFKKESKDVHIDLPGPLSNLTITGKVNQGEITITRADMEGFFNPRVDSIVELISSQIAQITRMKYHVKNVFLVGGFGQSEFLQKELEFSLKLRNIALRRPDKMSWAAVVRGGVICGVEKDLIRNPTKMKSCVLNYGVCISELFSEVKHQHESLFRVKHSSVTLAVGQMKWLVKKGDVILSNRPREVSQSFNVEFTAASKKAGSLPIYSYPDDDHIPDTFENRQHELTTVHTLKYDLAPIPLLEFSRGVVVQRVQFYTATLKLKLILSEQGLRSELYFVSQQPKPDLLLDSKPDSA